MKLWNRIIAGVALGMMVIFGIDLLVSHAELDTFQIIGSCLSIVIWSVIFTVNYGSGGS